MPEATTPTATTGPGETAKIQVQGPVVGLDADAKKREAEQKKKDEVVAKAATDAQEKEQKFFDGAIENITKYFHENTVSNRRRDDFITRLSRELRHVQTVAAASKVRGRGVIESPAETGPGVQVKPITAPGEKAASGEGMPTANPVAAPGTKNPTKVEEAK